MTAARHEVAPIASVIELWCRTCRDNTAHDLVVVTETPGEEVPAFAGRTGMHRIERTCAHCRARRMYTTVWL